MSLVNALATRTAGGRRVPEPDRDDELRSRAERALRDADALRSPLSVQQARGLEELAGRIREIFAAVHERRDDAAGKPPQRSVRSQRRPPHLHRTGDGPLHLHFHLPDAGFVHGWTAGCAVGLAYALGSGHGDRLGACAGPDCERVFVDLSRNGSRRFCGTACQNRVEAAHYRARQRAGG